MPVRLAPLSYPRLLAQNRRNPGLALMTVGSLAGLAATLIALGAERWHLLPFAVLFMLIDGGSAVGRLEALRVYYPLSPSRLAALDEDDLVLLDALLDSEHPLNVYGLLYVQQLDRDKVADYARRFRRLWQAGLLGRQLKGGGGSHRHYFPVAQAAQLRAELQEAIEQREQGALAVGPLGPRSRSSELAA